MSSRPVAVAGMERADLPMADWSMMMLRAMFSAPRSAPHVAPAWRVFRAGMRQS